MEDKTQNTGAAVPENTAEENTTAPAPREAALQAENSALMQRLDSMEKLLEQQVALGKKTARSRGFQAVFMLLLVVVFAVGFFWLDNTLNKATRELPELITTTTKSVQQLETTLQDISKIDFGEMNTAVGEISKGVADINFEALNSSIEELNKVVSALSNVVGFFG